MLYSENLNEMFDEMMAEMYPVLTVINVLFVIAMFIFKGIAIYTIAGRKGIENRWLAFIPFVNWLLLGKVIGRVKLWGHELKNLGFWVCITSAVDFIFTLIMNYNSYVYLLSNLLHATPILPLINTNSITFLAIELLSYVVSLAYIFFEVNIIFATFRIYFPEKALLFSLLSIFLEIFGVLLFAVRNREEVSYEEYVRRRYASYNSSRYNNGGYNGYNGYNNGNGGYNGGNNRGNTSNGYENPFPEFDDDNHGNNGGNGKNDEDDLFN